MKYRNFVRASRSRPAGIAMQGHRSLHNQTGYWAGLALMLALCSPAIAALKVGWAQADITPKEPVLLAGQFPSRVSEGVLDPITATVLTLEADGEHVVFVTCDVVSIADKLRDSVRARLANVPGLDPMKVILHATH